MPQNKLNPRVERKQVFHAWETWRDIGHGRSYNQAAKLLGINPSTVSRWAKLYGWEERLKEYSLEVVRRQERGDLVAIDSPVSKRLTDIMNKMESIINSAFKTNAIGALEPIIKISSLEDLSRFVGEYRKFLEVYHKIALEHTPVDKRIDRSASIKQFNVYMDGVSQEERINMMKGVVRGITPGRNKRSPGNVQEADNNELPGQGDED